MQGSDDAEIVLEEAAGPLVLTFVEQGQEHVFVTFDPIADSNWPYLRGMGVFLFNAVEYPGTTAMPSPARSSRPAAWWHACPRMRRGWNS